MRPESCKGSPAITGKNLSPPGLKGSDETREGAYGEAHAAPFHVMLFTFGESWTSDIKVRPWCCSDEFLEKECRGDRPTPSSPGIFYIGDGAFDEVAVFRR
jgi:hypothetical protein